MGDCPTGDFCRRFFRAPFSAADRGEFMSHAHRVLRATFLAILASLLGSAALHSPAAFAQADPALAAAPSYSVGINVKAPSLGMTPARGNGLADDTAALQAEIQYCQDHNVPLLLPSGVYKITAPLHIAIPPSVQTDKFVPIQSGIVIRGMTNHAVQPDAPTGVTILMAGAHQDCLIQIGGAASYHMVISDVSLDGGPPGLGTKHALHALYTRWSGLRLDNVQTTNVDTALAISGTPPGHTGTGGNGEYLNAYNCFIGARRCCYQNFSDSGQAYLHRFVSCAFGTSQPGGTAFEIGNSNGGCQCDFFGTSLTMAPGDARSPSYRPNVFLHDFGTNDPLNWWGGRAENVNTLIQWNGGGPGLTGRVNIEGMAFTINSGKGSLLFGGGTNCQYAFCVRSCYLSNYGKPAPIGFIYGGGGFERITFDDCDFTGWSDMTALTDSPRTILRSCRYTIGADPFFHDLVHRQVPAKAQH